MLTAEQVLALAPDASSAKSGRDLANKRKWLSIARSAEAALWGECQGSGAKPYQTTVDLGEPAFRCTCPSRKFPCKHGLGLLMLYAVDPSAFVDSGQPAWVSEWLANRADRAEKQAAKKVEQAEKQVDPVAQARRAAQREDRIQAGIDDLDRWLRDLMRRGLANVDMGYKFWDTAASRLVDSQAPGLARMVREMSGIPSSGNGRHDRIVERIGLLYLALRGYRRLSTLSEEAQADLRSVIGWTYSQDEVLAGDGVADRWNVVARHVEEDDRLQVQRIWLQGQKTRREALILQFAHGAQGFGNGGQLSSDGAVLAPGSAFDGELAFFPSALPLRALIKSRAEEAVADIRGHASIASALDSYGRAVARFPWLDRYPICLDGAIPALENGDWQVVDGELSTLPVAPRFAGGWRLLALSGGRPITVCGEWSGTHLLPLGVVAEGRYTSLA